jgi:hypothetical protein
MVVDGGSAAILPGPAVTTTPTQIIVANPGEVISAPSVVDQGVQTIVIKSGPTELKPDEDGVKKTSYEGKLVQDGKEIEDKQIIVKGEHG